ncbi:hypothetical protein ZIOFF_003889 [Zingiber officinale]|uniref:Purple acid phosphatase n=1 Tax=Zingiber officinale TaxID=94328 RepID=A0A8J5I763_ZINOF|nr:hypothetical protein ZIOFF_003889 [Zingiber officinale]
MALLPLLLSMVSSFLFLSSMAELPRLEHPLKSDGSLSLLVIGDWGRKGTFNQTLVAAQMGRIGESLDIDFVVSTGDNFYEEGLTGIDDKEFEESFTNIYAAESLQKQWYSVKHFAAYRSDQLSFDDALAVLGNHDYIGDVLAQLSPVLRQIDRRWLCLRSFVLNAEIVDFFFVDTTPFVEHYWNKPKGHHYDWRGVAPRETYISNLVKDLDLALKESPARWKVVVGHHTIRSASVHGDTIELQLLLLPILKENGVDFYVNGHDHCLEHISSNDCPLQFLTSGGGSKAWRGILNSVSDKLEFFYDGQGFMSLQLTKTQAHVVFYDAFGNALHKRAITKQSHSQI